MAGRSGQQGLEAVGGLVHNQGEKGTMNVSVQLTFSFLYSLGVAA